MGFLTADPEIVARLLGLESRFLHGPELTNDEERELSRALPVDGWLDLIQAKANLERRDAIKSLVALLRSPMSDNQGTAELLRRQNLALAALLEDRLR